MNSIKTIFIFATISKFVAKFVECFVLKVIRISVRVAFTFSKMVVLKPDMQIYEKEEIFSGENGTIFFLKKVFTKC